MEVGVSERADHIIKKIDPALIECQCCREFKTKEEFSIANRAHKSTQSCFAGYQKIMTCDECKTDLKSAIQKRDKNIQKFGF